MASHGRRRGPSNAASLASRSQSLPQLAPVQPTNAGLLSSSEVASGSGAAITKCRGEFCRIAPSTLRGLYDSKSGGETQDDPSDESDDDADNAPRRHGIRRDRDAVLPDDGRRFKIGNNNVLLAKAEIPFMMGTIKSAGRNSNDITLQWQEADNVHRMELGRTNPSAFYKQVSVCRNCHRIYADLANFRELGFQWNATHKNAWSTGQETTKARLGVKKNKGGERSRVGEKEAMMSPEEDATLEFDRLFLEELAKHSGTDDADFGQQYVDSSARSETEVDLKARSASLRSLSDALPMLNSNGAGPTPVMAKKKKPNNATTPGSKAEDQSGNQQAVRDVGNAGATARLESVIIQLREQLATEKATIKRVEAQKQILEQKLSQSQTLLQEKEDEFRKRLLEAELDSMTKKMHQNPAQQSAPASSSASTDISELIETIDCLNHQLHEANNAAEKLRRDLLQAHQQDLKRLHEKYQLEMESLRLSEYTAKEQTEAAHMQMNHWQSEAQVALTQAKSARAALDDLTKTRLPQLEEKNQRLERQIAELKAKPATSSTSSATNGSAQDVVAVEKHLNNKIDYLKAQLASEMKCKEELGSHLAGITASMEALKNDRRVALADQEEAHKRHLERVESSFAQEKDAMNVQLASFQGKITTLQANVTDLVQELTMWKSKEANTKLALEKMAEENVRLTRQIVDLEGHIEALQDERKRDGNMGVKNANDETQRMQMEALLRRLDNERQYLKNQVDNESELKIQSQRRAQGLEEELRNLKLTSDELTKIAEHKISSLNAEKSNLERQMRDEKAVFEESKLMLARQLKDMQVKFLQAREQALIEKDELEKARIELSESRSQIMAAREETLKEKEYGKSANERMSKALATIKASLKTMEEEKNLRIHRLEEENKVYMQKLAKAQGELLVLENKWSEDKQSFRRQQAITKFVSLVDQRLEGRYLASKACAFWQLYSVAVATKSLNEIRTAHEKEISEREIELRQDFMDKCDELTQALHSERVNALQQADAVRIREKEELQQYYEQERSQLEEDLQHIHARQMRELEEQYEQTLRSVDAQSAAALVALQSRCDEVEQERNEVRAAFAEIQVRCEEVGANVETKHQAALAEQVEREKRWEDEKQHMIDLHARQLRQIKEAADCQLNEQVETHERALADIQRLAEERNTMEMHRLRVALERERAENAENMEKKHKDELEALKDMHTNQLEQEKQRLIESLQEELEKERAKHDTALKAALERVEVKTQGHLETLQKDMNDRKANALLQCTAKWQKAMEDLQARLEIEKKIAYESGLQDRENEWQQAALQIKQKQKEELESVQNEAVRAIHAAEERHRMLLQSQAAAMRKDLEEKQRVEVETLRTEIISSEKTRSRLELEAALAEQERVLLTRFSDDAKNLREELADDHEADMKSLEEIWLCQREELVRLHEQERNDAIKRLEDTWASKLEQNRVEAESVLSSKMAEQEALLLRRSEVIQRGMQDSFEVELQSKLKEQEQRLLNDQEEAINQVQEDSERLIEQVEVAMSELKKQKEALEMELTRLRSALEEAEDAHFDMEENLKKQQKSMVFQLMVLIMHAKKSLEEGTRAHTKQLVDLQLKHDQLDAMLQRDKRHWERDVAQIRETWTQLQSHHREMLQTLTNYKRDELVAHRSASAVLSNEVAIVLKQMDEVTEMKLVLEKEIDQLQTEAHTVEANLRQLMLQHTSTSSSLSGTGDSSLNMALVAKKRRLNEEFEALLEQVERKKSEVRNIEKTLASLRQRREEKEGELKSMERKLVEILVGQQKQMLTLLNATRDVALPAALLPITAS